HLLSLLPCPLLLSFFFFNDTPTTAIYTLSLHDALPICRKVMYSEISLIARVRTRPASVTRPSCTPTSSVGRVDRNGSYPQSALRSEEHTSELQSLAYLVCRLLLEKKKKNKKTKRTNYNK